MVAREKDMLQHYVQAPYSIINYWYKMEQEGKISRNKAQKYAADTISHLRYGHDGKDYFWINTDKSNTVSMVLISFPVSFGGALHTEVTCAVAREPDELRRPPGVHIFRVKGSNMVTHFASPYLGDSMPFTGTDPTFGAPLVTADVVSTYSPIVGVIRLEVRRNAERAQLLDPGGIRT